MEKTLMERLKAVVVRVEASIGGKEKEKALLEKLKAKIGYFEALNPEIGADEEKQNFRSISYELATHFPVEMAHVVELKAVVVRLEAVYDPAILAFDEFVCGPLTRVVAAAEKIGGKVLESTKILEEAFLVEKDFLIRAKQSQKPDKEGLQEFLKPLNDVLIKANTLIEGKSPDYFNHLKTIANSLAALVWVEFLGEDCCMSFPTVHVEESWQTAESYNNQVLLEFKSIDSDHVEWANAVKELYVPNLRDYVKKNFPLGPTWGPSDSVVPPAAKPVPASPPYRTGGVNNNAPEKTAVKAASFSFKNTAPKMELQMRRTMTWVVENQVGEKSLVIEDCHLKQCVDVYGCKDSVLQVKGKVNKVTLCKCTNTRVILTGVVAACEILSCNSVEVQCQGRVPTISVHYTLGCQVYLSKDYLLPLVISTDSSAINLIIPASATNADLLEHSFSQHVH